MNIVEYFVRANLRRKIATLRNSAHDIEERLAELNSLLDTWESLRLIHKGGIPSYIVNDIAKGRAERAKLRVRQSKLQRDLDKLELELKMEYSKQRIV